MTCIAWDGNTLAADKRSLNAGMIRTTTKIYLCGSGKYLVGFAGDTAQGREMMAWFDAGAKAEDFPASQRDKDKWATFIAIGPDRKVMVYENTPHPIHFEDKFYASGTGRDFALAAMHLGKSAKEAVELACLFQADCGNGVDTLQFEQMLRRWA